ncbi:MAG: YdiY family protein [Acidobacteriota bacterium]
MNRGKARTGRGAAILICLAASMPFQGGLLAAPPDPGWADEAEFSLVMTSGNSEASTLGLKNSLVRRWATAALEIKAGGIRSETTATSRTALETPAGFLVLENRNTEISAENYYIKGRYDRDLSPRVFWFSGGAWERNRFAGIRNRYSLVAGLGNQWFDREDLQFRTDYSLTYTDEQDILELPGGSDNFAGARLAWDFLVHFGLNAAFANTFALNAHIGEKEDYRGDMTSSVSVSFTGKLALKVSLQWLYDNQPSFVDVPLFSMPPAAGGIQTGTVPLELERLDTLFTASLVIEF